MYFVVYLPQFVGPFLQVCSSLQQFPSVCGIVVDLPGTTSTRCHCIWVKMLLQNFQVLPSWVEPATRKKDRIKVMFDESKYKKGCNVNSTIVYVVVQFYPWFKLYSPLFLGMVMYDNVFKTKEKN